MARATGVAAVLLAVAAVAAPGAATVPNVRVHMHVAAGVSLVAGAGVRVPVHSCDVSVPEYSDGIVVLAAAERQGCIASYQVVGPTVRCIDRICRVPYVTAWFVANETRAWCYNPPGVLGFSASPGATIDFRYYTGSPLC